VPSTNSAGPPTGSTPKVRRTSVAAAYPETWQYRFKNKVLGPPMVNEQLSSERLSNPVALGVLAPDMISSSAYGTEQMLVILVPLIGLGAFTLVIPITIAILAVLFFVTLSYLEVIGYYTKAGGSYVVARDNFGPKFAQVAAVALLIDYIVTVAVQTSAGTAVLTSMFPSLLTVGVWPHNLTVPITVAVVLIMLYGNLRGIREAGRIFAFPTYFFVCSLTFVVLMGYWKEFNGQLVAHPLPTDLGYQPGHAGSGLLMGLSIFYVLKAFANGGASLTGLEAVSNGISSFRRPESRNGRITLVIMCCILGFLVSGTSLLAKWTHAVPYAAGTPTVVSQEVRFVLGSSSFGHAVFYVVLTATMLILFTGGNTSFNGFPFLANFVAGDSFLPRQLTKRGHRLSFSNGIIVLAIVALVLIVAFDANVNRLVALYAIGVFTGFTIAGAGMVKHHRIARTGRWKLGVVINGFSAVLSASVVMILLITKFTEGSWLIAVVAPPMYFALLRLNRQYTKEAARLETGAVEAVEAPLLRRHVVVVLIEELDMAAARAIQYARTLRADDLRAVHFNLDVAVATELTESWQRLGLRRFPLDVVECRDRRLDRAALELVAEVVGDGNTECTVLLPRRLFNSRLARVLHDRTADHISAAVTEVPHVAATIVPFSISNQSPETEQAIAAALAESRPQSEKPMKAKKVTEIDQALAARAGGTAPIGDLIARQRSKVAGRIRSVRVQPGPSATNLECVVTDDTGDVTVVFLGRRTVPGIEAGARLVVEGMVSERDEHFSMLNPDYELVAGPEE